MGLVVMEEIVLQEGVEEMVAEDAAVMEVVEAGDVEDAEGAVVVADVYPHN